MQRFKLAAITSAEKHTLIIYLMTKSMALKYKSRPSTTALQQIYRSTTVHFGCVSCGSLKTVLQIHKAA